MVDADAALSHHLLQIANQQSNSVFQSKALATVGGLTTTFVVTPRTPSGRQVRRQRPISLLASTGISGDLVMEPGPVEVSAGTSSSDIRSSANVTVTARTRTIRGEERAFLSVATIT